MDCADGGVEVGDGSGGGLLDEPGCWFPSSKESRSLDASEGTGSFGWAGGNRRNVLEFLGMLKGEIWFDLRGLVLMSALLSEPSAFA